jgi:hypothetical protein
MRTREYEEADRILDRILPEYQRASQMPHDETDQNLYKGIGSDGSIYLMSNPVAWPRRVRMDGHAVVHRIKPQFKYTLAQAKAVAAEQQEKKQKAEIAQLYPVQRQAIEESNDLF